MRTSVMIGVLLLGIVLSGCNPPGGVYYEAPRDQLGDLCSGGFVNTNTACVNDRFVNQNILSGGYYRCGTYWSGYIDIGDGSGWGEGYAEPYFESDTYVNPSCVYYAPAYLTAQNNDALILVTEPGNIDSNAENMSALRAGYPAELYPYFRTLQNNSLAAFLRQTLESNGQKYGRIYLVRSDSESKSLLLGAIRRVAAAHRKVDMLLAIHGTYSAWNLSPDLSVKLTSNELVSFGASLGAERNKIRAVFSTACFGRNTYMGKSMTQAVAEAFPTSVNYGSIGINYAPMHRDLMAFESYYSGVPFSQAVLGVGNGTLKYNQATGGGRTHIHHPAILGRGCYDYWLGKHCENLTVKFDPFVLSQAAIYNGESALEVGALGNRDVTIGTFCRHPQTGANMPAGSYYGYYLFAYGSYSGHCATAYRTATCTSSGWSPALPSYTFQTCSDPWSGGGGRYLDL